MATNKLGLQIALIALLGACSRTPPLEQAPTQQQPLAPSLDPAQRTWIRRPATTLCGALKDKLVAPDALVTGRVSAVDTTVKWIQLDPSDSTSLLPFTKITLSVENVVRSRPGVSVDASIAVNLVGSVASDELKTSGEGPLLHATNSTAVWGLKQDSGGKWFLQSGLLFWNVTDQWHNDWQFVNDSTDYSSIVQTFDECGSW